MSEQSSNKKEINGPMFVLAVFITAVIVSVIILILTAPRSDFENFGNTAGTRLEDILKFGSLGTNVGQYIVYRKVNVRKMVSPRNNNDYYAQNPEYQMIGLSKTNKETIDTLYIIPMNVSGKQGNDDYIVPLIDREGFQRFNLTGTYPQSIVRARSSTNQLDYFLIPSGQHEKLNVKIPPLTSPSPDTKYSPWYCDTTSNNRLYGTTRVPDGYGVAGRQVRNKTSSERTCGTSANRPNTRIRLIYHKK